MGTGNPPRWLRRTESGLRFVADVGTILRMAVLLLFWILCAVGAIVSLFRD